MKIVRSAELSFVPASHENPLSPGVLKKVLLSREDFPAGRVMMLNWACLPQGRAFQEHYHEDMEEYFVILEGRAEMQCGSEKSEVGPGDLIVVPQGVPHLMRSSGRGDVQYIVFGISSEQGGETVTLG